ncbi:MAG: hypothetical protein AAFR16_09680 [Pseudomonadota bacterium]
MYFTDWAEVYGEFWFWAAAGLFWIGAASELAGAPRNLIAEALREEERAEGPGAAAFALGLVRHRLARGRMRMAGPLALPVAGVGAAYLAAEAALGGVWALAALTAIGPVVGARLAIEPQLRAAAAERDADRAATAFDQLWRAQFAGVVVALFATAVAAAATAPGAL